ncbi:MAG TPA: hypothetical protein ENK18_14085 [Deltaproteobacteria bacterium]|nr:hypothetical protein [Deltaproteobacteria bacterium]
MQLLLSWLPLACTPPSSGDKPIDTAGPPLDTAPTDTAPPGAPDSACGETSYHDLVVLGLVEDSAGQPAVGARVWLEDRGLSPTVQTMGEATVDPYGQFEMSVIQLASVEDCWGILLDYVLVGELANERGEEGINATLHNAILDGSGIADRGSIPLQLEVVESTP